mgnify:CR=1 FL=1
MHPLENDAKLIANFLSEHTEVDRLPKVDAIFCFGHSEVHTPKHAAKLYHKGLAPLVVVTGFVGHRNVELPKGFTNQADLFAHVLIKQGVPDSAILREKESRNTLDNVLLGMEIVRESKLKIESLILCALPSHLRRCRATFAMHYPKVKTFGSSFPFSEMDWMNDYRIGRLVGEVDRLIFYAIRGHIAPSVIPRTIKVACEKIRGFVKIV